MAYCGFVVTLGSGKALAVTDTEASIYDAHANHWTSAQPPSNNAWPDPSLPLIIGSKEECGSNCGKVLKTSETGEPELFGPAPEITSVVPIIGPSAGGTEIKISGSGLATAAKVIFEGADALECGNGPPAPCYVDPVNPDAGVFADTPPHEPGPVPITVVTKPGAQEMSSQPSLPGSNLFTYLPRPVLSAIDPSCGSLPGGDQVAITGSALDHLEAIQFGDKKLTSFIEATGSRVVVKTPPNEIGSVPVTAKTLGGLSAPSVRFSYPCVAQEITRVDPDVISLPGPGDPPSNAAGATFTSSPGGPSGPGGASAAGGQGQPPSLGGKAPASMPVPKAVSSSSATGKAIDQAGAVYPAHEPPLAQVMVAGLPGAIAEPQAAPARRFSMTDLGEQAGVQIVFGSAVVFLMAIFFVGFRCGRTKWEGALSYGFSSAGVPRGM